MTKSAWPTINNHATRIEALEHLATHLAAELAALRRQLAHTTEGDNR